MKSLKYILITGCIITALVGCSDSFLDKQPNGGYVSEEQLEEVAKWNPNVLLGQSYGITRASFAIGTGGTDRHDDFGQKSVDITLDLMSGDMAMASATYPWFADAARLMGNAATEDKAYMLWRYYFQIIKAANTIFDLVGGDGNVPEEGSKNRVYYGQAKAMRAHSYFSLVNLYNQPYEIDKNKKSLPIYRSQTSIKAEGLSTVEEVYDLIISDLKEAVELLDGYPRPIYSGLEIKSEVNRATAEGMLAYAYLTKGDYENAAKCAMNIIREYPMLSYQNLYNTGFSNIAASNWIWGIDLTTENTGGLGTFWGHIDVFTYSYAFAGDFKVCDQNLYNQISETDKRKFWFDEGFYLLPVYKFYNAKQDLDNPDMQWIDDEVMMRVEEMYLIAAEAYTRLGNLTAAKEVFTAFLAERDPAVAQTVEIMTQEQLLESIYLNWRIEMWGEGKGLLTMKRFKKSVTRGGNHYYHAGQTFSWDDDRYFVFEIPEREVLQNPLLNK